MPTITRTRHWDDILKESNLDVDTTYASAKTDSIGTWVTTTTPDSTWSVATTTTDSPYIWTTSTTPITTSTLTITSAGPYDIVHAPDLETREREFPLFDTYNLDSPKGREKFVEAFKEYLLASFHPYITLRLDG